MALVDEVQNRYRTSDLTGLTRPNSTSASTVDTTYLERACDDVEGLFAALAGVAYDGTKALHVALACDGVLIRLKQWAGAGAYPKSGEEWEAWEKRVQRDAKTMGRDRFAMKSSSEVTESDENPNDETVSPDLDREVWDDVIPDQP